MLKKMTAACICFMVCAGTVSAQERYTVDKVVAVVGNSAIKYSELVEARNVLVEERRKQGYTSDRDPMNEALEGLLVQKLLYNQALIDSVQINLDAVSSEVEARLAMMTEEAGSTPKWACLIMKYGRISRANMRRCTMRRRCAATSSPR